MQKIVPSLWFNNNAQEAIEFYQSVFKDSKIHGTSYYGPNMHKKEGDVLAIYFELNGEEFIAINAGPEFPFTNAVSFTINCKDQKEIDYYWEKLLSGGGREEQCGWLKDKFGLSWQVVPEIVSKMHTSKDQAAINRLMAAVMKMVKLDIATLEKAYKG